MTQLENTRPAHKLSPRREQDGATRYSAGQRTSIFAQGDAADYVYEVLEGTVMISKTMADGRRQIVELLGPYALFGITPLSAYPTQAQALTGVELRRIGRREAEMSRQIQRRWRNQLETELEAAQNHALLLGRKSAMERVASFLLSLPPVRACGTPSPSLSSPCFTKMNQAEIGDYLGLKVETISRSLAVLKRRMIIAQGKRGQFIVLDAQTLRSLANSQ